MCQKTKGKEYFMSAKWIWTFGEPDLSQNWNAYEPACSLTEIASLEDPKLNLTASSSLHSKGYLA